MNLKPFIVSASLVFIAPRYAEAGENTLHAIEFDRSVSPGQRHIIERDLDSLCNFDYTRETAAKEILRRMLRIEDVTCAELRGYLEERIRLIIGDTIDMEGRIRLEKNHAFDRSVENSLSFRFRQWFVSFFSSKLVEAIRKSPVGAFNFGMDIKSYLLPLIRRGIFDGYSIHFTYFDHRGKEAELPVTVFRAGIIGVAQRFFSLPPRVRLGILFHEARHGDGIVLEHDAYCHKGAGWRYPKCDRFVDGAYGIGVAFLNYALHVCDGCTDAEKRLIEEHTKLGIEHMNPVEGFDHFLEFDFEESHFFSR